MKKASGLILERRNILKMGGAVVLGSVTSPMIALFSPAAVSAQISWEKLGAEALPPQESFEVTLKRLFGGRTIEYLNDEKIKFTTPNVAENGAVVPVEVELLSPLVNSAFIKTIYLLVEKNKRPQAATFSFSMPTGAGYAASYLRMGGTSWVHAVLETNDSKLIGARNEIKVVAGGCGG